MNGSSLSENARPSVGVAGTAIGPDVGDTSIGPEEGDTSIGPEVAGAATGPVVAATSTGCVAGDTASRPVIGGTTVRIVGSRRGILCSNVLISPEAVENESRESSTILAVAGRSSGSFERHRITSADNDRGTSGRTSTSGFGSSDRTATRIFAGVVAANGDLPFRSS